MKLDDMLRDVRDSQQEIEELADQGRVVDLVRLARAIELERIAAAAVAASFFHVRADDETTLACLPAPPLYFQR